MRQFAKVTLTNIMLLIFIFSCISFADSGAYANLPALQTLNGDTTISHDVLEDGKQMPVTGLFERAVTLSDADGNVTDMRTVKLYIPETAKAGSYLVVLAVPNGQDTLEWLSESGWVESADAHNFCLYLLEPENGTWQSEAEELAYIDQAYTDIANKRGKHYLFMPTNYLVGYGEGGSLLQMYAMENPLTVAAAAFVDANDISENFIDEMSTANYPNSEIKYSQIPVPVLLIGNESDASYQSLIAYWKRVNKTAITFESFMNGSLYKQMVGTLPNYTPESCSSVVAITEASWQASTNQSEQIYADFLSQYSRYGTAVGGNTLGYRPDYDTLNVEIKDLYVAGVNREYMVYVPESAKGSDKVYPAVYLFHGSQQTDEMMFDISRAWELADQEGFILILGQALSDVNNMRWPAWDSSRDAASNYDLAYLESLLSETAEDYPIDTSRRYATGHSNGGMFGQTIGLNMSEYFAAIGVTSGPFLDGAVDFATESVQKELMPFYMSFGQYDLWPYDFSTSTSVQNTLNYWLERNTDNQTLSDYTALNFDRFEDYVWYEDGTPVVRYNVTLSRGHSIIPKEYELMWQEWFSKWHKDANGVNVYTD
jgi:poly(3-hydroxybutyrate) depolymerase